MHIRQYSHLSLVEIRATMSHVFAIKNIKQLFSTFFRAQEPKAPVTYFDHALSGVCRPSSVCRPSVRLSSVCRPLDYLHFQLLLQNRLMDFDETWYGWSTQGPLQVLLFFGPWADPGRGQNRSRGVPFLKKLLLHTRRLQQQTEWIAMI